MSTSGSSLRSVTPHVESRPPRSPNLKKPSLLNRLTTPRSASFGDRASVVARSSDDSPSSLASPSKRGISLRSIASSLRSSTYRSSSSSSSKKPCCYDPMNPNLLVWMQMECPQDVLPKILAYAGPQMTAVFGRTNRFWRSVVSSEATWRSLCEELYKWKEGDEIPESWREYYWFNPCVPVDYKTVARAFSVARGSSRPSDGQKLRILLRPGKHYLREALTVHMPFNGAVELKTMELPVFFEKPVGETAVEPATVEASESSTSGTRKRSSSSSFRNFLCRTVEVETQEGEDPSAEFAEIGSPTLSVPPKRATLILRTRRHNEPLLRIRQGTCFLSNLELRHISHGIDIWNGNAAVQIQPPVGPDDQPMVVVPGPTAVLDRVDITSASGRGIVNIDGGQVTIRGCYVHDCAATGIYVGGPGSRAIIEHTDVVRNGNGNNNHRRGIPRGHSGIYLEQGNARIVDCNISHNSLTGISAVSPDNAILNLEESDLVSNGTFQLEMPSPGTVARRESVTQNNRLESIGLARSRSGLIPDE